MPTISTNFLLVLTVLLVLSPSTTYAFGAGDIPDFAYLNGETLWLPTPQSLTSLPDKAFRHGDVESILENLVKHAGGPALGGGLLGFATSVIKTATGGAKFNKLDVKRVYFVCFELYSLCILLISRFFFAGKLASGLLAGTKTNCSFTLST